MQNVMGLFFNPFKPMATFTMQIPVFGVILGAMQSAAEPGGLLERQPEVPA